MCHVVNHLTILFFAVSQSDFPEYDVVLRRLAHFKQIFIINLVNNLLSLPLYKQISLIPVATITSQSPSFSHAGICNGNKENKVNQFMKKNVISLKEYLLESEPGLSSTLTKLANSPTEDTMKSYNHSLCHLYIPKKFINDLLQLKSLWRSDACLSTTPTTPQQRFQFDRLQKINPDLGVQTSQLTSKIFSELAREAASEIIRIYEYQIALLNSDLSIEMLASHCVDRIMSYIRQELNVGQKELKWNLYDIFDKPGLRRDVLLEQEDIVNPTSSCKNLFNFYAAPFSSPMVYGYRGQIIEIDYANHAFTAFQKELETYCDEVFWRYDDFHRMYVPFQLMIGTMALKRLSFHLFN
ncbi:hypothetical protein HELRODRAFT_162719 [Helobdella robusta]|uniref:Uncharacterized protein n=1 Tax=Helobdella robusta TaxID=6412 RepID=T1ET17_HELRO|nr:hypothetical protein HELRODRAFT_162719 [Helobdella robusta]ESN99208.1 hypothetical protein HELRODRAFT_162719 [Helobdella robusta]